MEFILLLLLHLSWPQLKMKEIWNSYIGLFRHENLIVVIGTITATLAVLTFLINFFFRPLLSRIRRLFAKINVSLRISHQISQGVFGTSVLPPILTVTITNKDRITRYIHNPSVRTSKKINGNNKFVVPKSKGTFPKKLKHGEQYTVDFDSMSLNNQILNYLNPNDTIGIVVSDTTGKKYKSNKFSVAHIIGHIQVANNLNK